MTLSRAQLASVVVATDSGDYSPVVLCPPPGARWAPRWVVVVARRPDGLLLAAPWDAAFEAATAVPADPFGLSVVLEVPARGADDPSIEAEPLLRVAVVDLAARGFSLLRLRPARGSQVLGFAEAAVSIDGAPADSEVWPHGPALSLAVGAWVEGLGGAAGGLEAFFSAGEGEGAADLAPGPRRRGRTGPSGTTSPDAVAEAVAAALQDRFAALEARLGALESGGGRVFAGPALAAPAALPPLAAASGLVAAGAPPPPASLSGALGLAPAGLRRGNLGGLVGSAPPRLADPATHGASAADAPIPEMFDLTADDGEAGDDDDDADLAPRDRALVKALSAQTRLLVSALSGARGSGDLDPLLGGPGELASHAVAGARGTAAMELQRREFERRPEVAVRATRELIAKANGTDPTLPQDARAFFERHGSFPTAGRQHDLAYVALLLANVWNKLELGETAAAQALVGRGMAAVDQMSKGGSAQLGFLWTHLPEPPWGTLDRPHRPESAPYSLLAPPAAVAASVAYLKDLDAMAERLGALKPAPAAARASAEAPTASAKAQGRRPAGRKREAPAAAGG